jgi:hypothetical protein
MKNSKNRKKNHKAIKGKSSTDANVFGMDDAIELSQNNQIEVEAQDNDTFGDDFAKTYPFATTYNGFDNTPLL